MPPHEFKAQTITRCEVEFEEKLMDTKRYNIFWQAYNYTLSTFDKQSYAFVYDSPKASHVYGKMGE